MQYLFTLTLSALVLTACTHNPAPLPTPSPSQIITSFEACVAAGNPVMESYPASCNANGQTFTQDIGNELEMTNLINLSNPRPGQTITSPLKVTGQARGTYYFEATFPLLLETNTGEVLVQHFAEAEGEWMTEDFVPYTSTLTFTVPIGVTEGTLTLEKANPSGLPEQEQSLRIPVTF